jgi:hypothetical protein
MLKKKYPGRRILVVPENQLGFFETRICELVRDIDDVYVIHQDGGEKAGIRKTEALTKGYVDRLVECLTQNCVKFDLTWFTLTTPPKQSSLSPNDVIKFSLKDELLRFKLNEKNKLTGKINNYTDDKAVAFMMFYFWGNVFLSAEPTNPYLIYLPESAISKFALSRPYRNTYESTLYEY